MRHWWKKLRDWIVPDAPDFLLKWWKSWLPDFFGKSKIK
jgi:hypothetical protein